MSMGSNGTLANGNAISPRSCLGLSLLAKLSSGMHPLSDTTKDPAKKRLKRRSDDMSEPEPLEMTAPAVRKPRRKRRKSSEIKRKDPLMPRRPVSAYNLFFREERAKLMANIKSGATIAIVGKKTSQEPRLFEVVAKTIGERWRNLLEAELAGYKARAASDKERYNREMKEYRAKKQVAEALVVTTDGSSPSPTPSAESSLSSEETLREVKPASPEPPVHHQSGDFDSHLLQQGVVSPSHQPAVIESASSPVAQYKSAADPSALIEQEIEQIQLAQLLIRQRELEQALIQRQLHAQRRQIWLQQMLLSATLPGQLVPCSDEQRQQRLRMYSFQ